MFLCLGRPLRRNEVKASRPCVFVFQCFRVFMFMKKHFIKIILLIIVATAGAYLCIRYFYNNKEVKQDARSFDNIPAVIEKTDRIKEIKIVEGATYGELMTLAGMDYGTVMEIYEASEPIYDLVKIRCGRCLKLIYDKDTDEFKELVYKIDSEDELHVKKISVTDKNINTISTTTVEEGGQDVGVSSSIWQAEITLIPYEVKIKLSEGVVESSMYEAAIEKDIDIRAIIELANAFQWTIDFAMDPRVNDVFKFVHEDRFLDGEYVMPGKILAGKYVNDGKAHYVYYFEETEDNMGYFDENGNSVQKIFLKAPVAFKYISSGFTTGPRYLAAFKMFTADHRAIDYAAAIGTPVRAVGDGTITFAGWNSQGYGYTVSIHHNATYSTRYCHLSKILVKYGQKVKQSDIIGNVGSTGFSTGPHLHYEMIKHGAKINPLREVLPPGEPIKEENKERFFNEIKKWQEMLGS